MMRGDLESPSFTYTNKRNMDSIVFSPEHSRGGHAMCLFHIQLLNPIFLDCCPVQAVTGLAWAGSHSLMSSAMDNTLKRWDTATGSAVDSIAAGKALLCCACIAAEGGRGGGAVVASGAADGSLRWWDCRAGAKQSEALVRSSALQRSNLRKKVSRPVGCEYIKKSCYH